MDPWTKGAWQDGMCWAMRRLVSLGHAEVGIVGPCGGWYRWAMRRLVSLGHAEHQVNTQHGRQDMGPSERGGHSGGCGRDTSTQRKRLPVCALLNKKGNEPVSVMS